jgi:hypothetical protein
MARAEQQQLLLVRTWGAFTSQPCDQTSPICIFVACNCTLHTSHDGMQEILLRLPVALAQLLPGNPRRVPLPAPLCDTGSLLRHPHALPKMSSSRMLGEIQGYEKAQMFEAQSRGHHW